MTLGLLVLRAARWQNAVPAANQGTEAGGCAVPATPLTQGFDGALRLLLLGAAAGHERRDGERIGPGGELRLGGCGELHGRRRAPGRAGPQGDKDPKRSAKFPSAVAAGREFREGQLESRPRSCSLACRCLGEARRNSDFRGR